MTQIRFDGFDLSPRCARTPRSRQRSRPFALVVAVLALFLLAACGGDGRMSKADYEQQMNDAGRRLSAVFGTIDENRRNLGQLAVRVRRAKRTLDQTAEQLAAVEPPEQAQAAHGRIVAALQGLSVDLERVARAADANDTEAVARARASLRAPASELTASFQELQREGFAINSG